jgi:hypothetical protein
LWWRKRSTRWEPPALGKQLITFITCEKEIRWSMLFIHTRNIQNIYSQIIYTQSDKKTNHIDVLSSYKHNIYSENKFRHIKSHIQHQTQSKKVRKHYIAEEKYSSPTSFPLGFEPVKIHEYTFFVNKMF